MATTIHDVPLDVQDKFEQLTLQVIGAGWKRYSSDAILHRLRWHYRIDKGERDFKCNDHWTAVLSRWFVDRHPEHTEFFEFRIRHSLGEHV